MEELRSLREELIDHVERLHAEKHKLGEGEGGEERRGDRGVGEGRGGREGGREGREGAGMLCMCIMLVHWSV